MNIHEISPLVEDRHRERLARLRASRFKPGRWYALPNPAVIPKLVEAINDKLDIYNAAGTEGFAVPEWDRDVFPGNDHVEIDLGSAVTVRLQLHPGLPPVESFVWQRPPARQRQIAVDEIARALVRWREPRRGAAS